MLDSDTSTNELTSPSVQTMLGLGGAASDHNTVSSSSGGSRSKAGMPFISVIPPAGLARPRTKPS